MAAVPTKRLLAAAVTACLALSACGQSDSAAKESAGGDDDIVLASAMLPESLNPIGGYGAGGVAKINEGLYTIETAEEGTGNSEGDGSGELDALPKLVPLLADSDPKVEDGGKKHTVKLKEGVTFTDGTDLDAEDVVATYEAILDPKVGSPLISDMNEIEKVEAKDDHTVVFTFKHALADVKPMLMVGIAPSEHVKKGQALTESDMNQKPIGTGPYKVDEFKPGRFVLSANEDYFQGAPDVKKIEQVEVKDDAARAQRMSSGEFDGTVLPPRGVSAFENKKDVKVYRTSSADWRGISLPKDNPITSTKEDRLALNMGIDRQAIIKGVLDGRGRPSSSMVPEVYGDLYTPKGEIKESRDEALTMLEGQGWKSEDGKLMKDGKQAELTIMYPSDDTLRRDVSVALADQLGKLGINTGTEGVD